jgi:hypothetical protein
MSPEIQRSNPTEDRPLVGDVEGLGNPGGRDNGDRDENIIRLLRDKLKDRDASNMNVTLPPRSRKPGAVDDEDKYEPQRLSRKICWQYDGKAHKVPLLRRHYI